MKLIVVCRKRIKDRVPNLAGRVANTRTRRIGGGGVDTYNNTTRMTKLQRMATTSYSFEPGQSKGMQQRQPGWL